MLKNRLQSAKWITNSCEIIKKNAKVLSRHEC